MRSRLTVRTDRDPGVRQLLDDPAFLADWAALAAACPWGTVFQSPTFVRSWYHVHDGVWEPILITGWEADRMVGLLPLALGIDGRIVAAGDFHAEYQTWLAEADRSNAFATAALSWLRSVFPGAMLRLAYVPGGTRLDWVRRPPHEGLVRVRRSSRGLIDLRRQEPIDAALRRKHRRSRLNGLRRLGEVRLDVPLEPEEVLAELDLIETFVDLRQGGLRGSRPFADNPRKRPLHEAMLAGGLILASRLRVGARTASIHLDMIDDDAVLLYLVGHDPRLAKHSPGDLHLYLLARELGRLGYSTYDLSPGTGYKERYADHSDTVAALTISFARRDRAMAEVARVGRRAGSIGLAALGRTPAEAALALQEVSRVLRPLDRRTPVRLARAIAVRRPRTVAFHVRAPIGEPDAARASRLERDRIEHLLLWRSDPWLEQTFLRAALERLEAGATLLTRLDQGRLVECWWVSADGSSVELARLAGRSPRVDHPADALSEVLRIAAERSHGGTIRVDVGRGEHRIQRALSLLAEGATQDHRGT